MDGLCYSDHTPTPGLVETKKVFEPVKVKLEEHCLTVSNLNDFDSLDSLRAEWELVQLPVR